eukprot:TRINITY_DN4270_c0_g1_i2.p1 TRINITY_DN4270_c0_g1~~TRINITY_DN4270_c0_g1_i2.p1  ORF type:complete len:106 (-),score=25.21 TRINITY_DN4270_c0_g1_i2:22-339(-)
MCIRDRFEDIIFVMEEVDRAGNLVRGSTERQSDMKGKGSSGQRESRSYGSRGKGAPAEGDTEQLTEQLDRIAQMEAVSYTHLRAHETVLDLVCRLLLEKKNKDAT